MATTRIPENPRRTLARLVEDAMEHQQIGQSEMRRRTGVSQSTVHRIAKAKVVSDWANIRAVAAELGLDLDRVEQLYLAAKKQRRTEDSGA